MVIETVSVSLQIPLEAMRAKSFMPAAGVTVIQTVVSTKVHPGNAYQATEVALRLLLQSVRPLPKQAAVSFPARAVGITRTVTETESVSEHTPFIPMMPYRVEPSAGETVMQLPVVIGVHAGSIYHWYPVAPEVQSVTESP